MAETKKELTSDQSDYIIKLEGIITKRLEKIPKPILKYIIGLYYDIFHTYSTILEQKTDNDKCDLIEFIKIKSKETALINNNDAMNVFKYIAKTDITHLQKAQTFKLQPIREAEKQYTTDEKDDTKNLSCGELQSLIIKLKIKPDYTLEEAKKEIEAMNSKFKKKERTESQSTEPESQKSWLPTIILYILTSPIILSLFVMCLVIELTKSFIELCQPRLDELPQDNQFRLK